MRPRVRRQRTKDTLDGIRVKVSRMIEKYEFNSSTNIHMTELVKVAAANALSLVLSILT